MVTAPAPVAGPSRCRAEAFLACIAAFRPHDRTWLHIVSSWFGVHGPTLVDIILVARCVCQVGGWSADYNDEEALAKDAGEDHSLQSAWDSSRSCYLGLVNDGETRWRTRLSGSYKKRKGGLSSREKVERFRSEHKVLKKITKRSGKVKVPYRLFTVERYKKVHKGRTPEQDGVKTKQFKHNGKMQEMAMVRKLDDGEADFVDEEEEGILIEQQLNDSNGVLREGQIEAEYKQVSKVIESLVADAAECSKLFDSDVEDTPRANPLGGAADGKADSERDGSDSDGSDDNSVCEAGTVGFFGSSGKIGTAPVWVRPMS